jgi:hypothetical protein
MLCLPLRGTAGGAQSYVVTGSGEAVRVTVVAVNAPATNVPFDVGAPVAQSQLDSLGTIRSFASNPYPGDLAVALPGTIAGFTGGQVTPPDYPFFAEASYPVAPERKVGGEGYELVAAASESETTGRAKTGSFTGDAAAAGSYSESEARRRADGTLEAAGRSEVLGFRAGPLSIARIQTTSHVSSSDSGGTQKNSELEVSGMTIADTAVRLTPAGLVLGDRAQPLPEASPLEQTLTEAGIEASYVSPREGEGVVVSPALQVTITRAVEGPVSPVRVTYVLGRSAARVEAGVGSGANIAVPEVSGVPPVDPFPTVEEVTASPDRSGGAPPSPPGPMFVGNSSLPSLPLRSTPATAVPPPEPSTSDPAPREVAFSPGRYVRLPLLDVRSAYSVVLVSGLCALMLAQLFRVLGSRTK